MTIVMVPYIDLDALETEGQNDDTKDIDVVSTEEMCRMINKQDQTVAFAVARHTSTIAKIIDAMAPKVRQGGRVIYLGAGTSGRLGILDASEIPPTYSANYDQWIGLIAGGDGAIQRAVEGAEDSSPSGAEDLERLEPPLSPGDCVIGLAASGRTPYVLGALEYASSLGCFTAGISCVNSSEMRGIADQVVDCPVGPEVVTGSTRMKSGTAQKMILNMISTGIQIKIGKTYGNLMVDVKRSNHKLVHRARRIFRAVLEPLTLPPWRIDLKLDLQDDDFIDQLIEACEGSVKQAMVAARWDCTPGEANERLEKAAGLLKKALEV